MSPGQKRGKRGLATKTRAYIEQAGEVIEGLREYWPLTVRQVFYQLVSFGFISNTLSEYKKLCRNLSTARYEGLVRWESIEDRSRRFIGSGGWEHAQDFIEDELKVFLRGYRRDLLQTQDVALELWIEKDALALICHGVADNYCIPVIASRGFSSVSYVNELRNRVYRNAESDKRTVILYFGDLDPSGWEMLPSMLNTLQNKMGLGGLVVGRRCALTPEQVVAYGLPRSPDAIKPADSRSPKYIEEFGELAVELDALPPATLETLVRESIEAELDLSLFEQERELEQEDLLRVGDMKRRAEEMFIGMEL